MKNINITKIMNFNITRILWNCVRNKSWFCLKKIWKCLKHFLKIKNWLFPWQKYLWSKCQGQFVLNIPSYRKVIIFMILIICWYFLPEFSTDFICMIYLNVVRRLTYEYHMQIILIQNSEIKVQKLLHQNVTCMVDGRAHTIFLYNCMTLYK